MAYSLIRETGEDDDPTHIQQTGEAEDQTRNLWFIRQSKKGGKDQESIQ